MNDVLQSFFKKEKKRHLVSSYLQMEIDNVRFIQLWFMMLFNFFSLTNHDMWRHTVLMWLFCLNIAKYLNISNIKD